MHTHSRFLLPGLVFCMAGSLHADTTGRISGTVTSSDGKPVAGALVVLNRVGMTLKRELKTDAKGNYFQIGLEPKEFEVTVSAPGYAPHKEIVKIPLGDTLIQKIVLRTVAEAAPVVFTSGAGSAPVEAGSIKAEVEATAAYNSAVELYSAKEFAKALAPSEAALKGFKDSIEQTKDEAAKGDLLDKSNKANRLAGMICFNLGKVADAKAYLDRHLETNPKDGAVVHAMLKIAKESKDKAGEAKYQALMDVIAPPGPETAYNEGVVALNAGNFKGAKAGALKALGVKADYADAFYILGIAEYGMSNLKAAKEALKKYMELAPTGSKAGEVKEMLKELR